MAGAFLAAAAYAMTSGARARARSRSAAGNFAKDGFAVGGAIDKATKQEAIDQALATCRKYEGAQDGGDLPDRGDLPARMFCDQFRSQPGTPGVGWRSTQQGRRRKSARWRPARPPRARRAASFCKLEQSFCDTHE